MNKLNDYRNAIITRQGDLSRSLVKREAIEVRAAADTFDQIQLAAERDFAVSNLDPHGPQPAGSPRGAATNGRGQLRRVPEMRSIDSAAAPGSGAMGRILRCLPGGRRSRYRGCAGSLRRLCETGTTRPPSGGVAAW